ncbi:MAG: nitroreductase family protein [Muribaculaceae bacterium]|nr:nitroreductase family protein [Muribaculaceae bacterium]
MDKDNYWKNRATVRSYSKQDIPQSLLIEMLEEASHAPTTGNMQLYSVVITRDPEMKLRLAPAHFNQPTVTGAPVVLTFCADYNRFIKWCEVSNAVPGYDNFQSFMTAVLDTALFAQQFNTIAERHGLGCCYLGTTTYNALMIAEVLDLPTMVVPVTTITVGYPAQPSQGEGVGRLPVEAIFHNEKYVDYTPASVKELYREKEERADSRSFVKENNKESLAQVFTDIRYTREACEHFSKIYSDFIKKQGF